MSPRDLTILFFGCLVVLGISGCSPQPSNQGISLEGEIPFEGNMVIRR